MKTAGPAVRPLERSPDIANPDRAAIAAVILGITAFAIAQGLTYPLISLTLSSRGVSDAVIGLNAAAFAVGLGAATLSIGRLTGLFDGGRLILAGLIGCSLCLMTFALTESSVIWFLARFALGFGAGVIFILSETWLNAACPDRLRGRVSGMYGMGMCGGFAAGPMAIPLFGGESGFSFAIVSVYLAVVAFASAVLTRRARTRPAPAESGALIRFTRAAPVLVAMVLAFGFADIAAIAVLPVYFVKAGHSQDFAAISVSVIALPAALAQPLVGLMLDRLSRSRVTICCALTAAAGFLALPLLASEATILIAIGLIGAASFALYTCALTLLGERFSGAMLLAGSAVYSLAYAVGSGAGSSLTGFAMDRFGLAAAPLTAGGVLAVFALLFAWRAPR
ncbi:MAG: MFS transporter [Alphaproteobacteria bacterium]